MATTWRLQRLPSASASIALAARILAILLALALAGIILAVSGANPIELGLEVIDASFGSSFGLQDLGVLLVPLIPTVLSLRTLDQLTDFLASFDGQRPRVLAFFSMIDRRKRLHREIAERLPAERDDVAAAVIPSLTQIERMSVERAPVAAFAPHSRAAQCYQALWAEVRARTL